MSKRVKRLLATYPGREFDAEGVDDLFKVAHWQRAGVVDAVGSRAGRRATATFALSHRLH